MNKSKRKAVVSAKECVACGACLTVCPLDAISIYRGLYAEIDGERCVGCGKCKANCPASVIGIEVRA